MQDIDRALAEITDIRCRLAAGTLFRGFGPAVIAATGGLALLTWAAQALWPAPLAGEPLTFLLCWVAVAVVSVALIAVEMVARSRRHHGGLATAMILNAIEQFLPAGFAGAALAVVLAEYAPESLWLVPGLWQVLVALGLFAALRTLPRAVRWVGAWYLVAGLGVLIAASAGRAPEPWMMGLPFAIGQGVLALVLHLSNRLDDERA